MLFPLEEYPNIMSYDQKSQLYDIVLTKPHGNMTSRKLLLTICFHTMLFQTNALQRFHQDAEDTDDRDGEMDELRDDIRNHHLNYPFKFDILGPPSRKTKHKMIGFPTNGEQAGRPRWLSKRCFTDMSYGYRLHPESSPYLRKWWPSAPDPRWPEYGWMDTGYGYPFKGSYDMHRFGTWTQPFPFFPCQCGKWCSEYYS